ncbi:hypothetical protein CIHG_02162 [Coccidioides immitis H538.4]|nr:hypothetical protein CIRG_00334 [Coccidioides immitis RMSCC 2394]KMU84377.1 hypothetical protein CIHG_02162 [Coccidioides immitis H538.4]
MSESTPHFDTLEHLPQLVTYPAISEDDKISALRLIADSVAQQRQIAAKSLISHPLCITALVLLISLAGKYQSHGKSLGDLAFVGTTGAGCIMILLVLVQWVTSAYLEEASRVGTWKWLKSEAKDPSTPVSPLTDDVFLVTKYGDEIIGTILLRIPSSPKSKAETQGEQPVLVRAWTVGRRYRQKGIGTGLLEEAFSYLQARSLHDLDVRFDRSHANSFRVLPGMFNRPFNMRENWARRKLEGVRKIQNVMVKKNP